MGPASAHGEGGVPLSREVRRLADALGRLIREHLELARADLRDDLRRHAIDAALVAAALPLLLAALLLFDGAVALALGSWLGLVWGFAIVGVLNLAAAGILGGIAAGRLRRARPLAEITEELRRDRLLAAQLRQELRDERGPLPPPGIRPYSEGGSGAAAS